MKLKCFSSNSIPADPRVEHFPLLGSPWPVLVIIILYLKFVNNWGQKMMANRQPFGLKTAMNVYNAVQIVLNLYIGITGFANSYFSDDYDWVCEPISQKVTPTRQRLIFVTYLYYLSKILDLLDTVSGGRDVI